MSFLLGRVQAATPNASGFDSSDPLDAATIAIAANRFTFCIRYLSFGDVEQPDCLTRDEASGILGSGLALMPVYPYAGPDWLPTASSGDRNGRRAAANAAFVGFPPGVNLWLDLEEVNSGSAVQDIVDHCNAWYDAVRSGGFVPGIYVGANCGLNSDQLFSKLKFEHYWKSGSDVPDIPVRGYQMVQTIPAPAVTVGSVEVDFNVTRRDGLGGNAQWLSGR